MMMMMMRMMVGAGLTESIVTRQALMAVHKGKRPFLVSRSTFPGSGFHAGHSLGTNSASAEDLYFSIPGILNFQMFGIPFVGANICGFEGITYDIISLLFYYFFLTLLICR